MGQKASCPWGGEVCVYLSNPLQMLGQIGLNQSVHYPSSCPSSVDAMHAGTTTPHATMQATPTPRCCVCLVPVRAAHATPTPYCSIHQPPVKVAADGRATSSGGCRLHGHADWYEPKRRCRICDAEAKRRRRAA